MEDEPIYDFKGLKETLSELGFQLPEARPWTPIKGQDVFVSQFESEAIRFAPEPDRGILFTDDAGYEHLGFLYMRMYNLEKFGKPRMHLCKCNTIQVFMDCGSFEAKYRFAETDSVMVVDTSNEESIDVEVNGLPLCKNCIKILQGEGVFSKIKNSDEFAQIINKLQPVRLSNANEVDIFGYVRDWAEISERIRKHNNYTCEKCHVQVTEPFDYRFIHVHHRNGNKEDNSLSNLQCLCIDCHSKVDAVHRNNFSSSAQQIMIQEFKDKYKNNQ